MAELWTFSGVNNWSDELEDYDDYVWRAIESKVPVSPARQYKSFLGTEDHYEGRSNVMNLKSEKRLNREARSFINDHPEYPTIRKGMFAGKRVACLLAGPKTNTIPAKAGGLVTEIYWSPKDKVPNQSMFRKNSTSYWKKFLRGGGKAWSIDNRFGRGFARGHGFQGFLMQRRPIIERRRKATGKKRKSPKRWKTLGNAPWALAKVNRWLKDDDIDHVFVAHSQGTNIALHLVNRGFA